MTLYRVQQFEEKQIQEITSKRDAAKFEDFQVGDSISVGVIIRDFSGFRTQAFDGICIGKSKKGLRTRFIVRRIGAANESMVQSFMFYLSNLEYIKIVNKGKVRRAKLYYLVDKFGKAAKVKQKGYARPKA